MSRYISVRQVVSILVLIACLVAVVLMKSRCGGAAANLFKVLDAPLLLDGGARDQSLIDTL